MYRINPKLFGIQTRDTLKKQKKGNHKDQSQVDPDVRIKAAILTMLNCKKQNKVMMN